MPRRREDSRNKIPSKTAIVEAENSQSGLNGDVSVLKESNDNCVYAAPTDNYIVYETKVTCVTCNKGLGSNAVVSFQDDLPGCLRALGQAVNHFSVKPQQVSPGAVL